MSASKFNCRWFIWCRNEVAIAVMRSKCCAACFEEFTFRWRVRREIKLEAKTVFDTLLIAVVEWWRDEIATNCKTCIVAVLLRFADQIMDVLAVWVCFAVGFVVGICLTSCFCRIVGRIISIHWRFVAAEVQRGRGLCVRRCDVIAVCIICCKCCATCFIELTSWCCVRWVVKLKAKRVFNTLLIAVVSGWRI